MAPANGTSLAVAGGMLPLSGQRDWGGTTPKAGLAAAAKRPHQQGSQQGRLPVGPPKTTPGQNGGMTSVAAPPIEQRVQGMAAVIHQRIPGAEVRLYSCGEAFGYGSRARGTAGPESDIDLLITAPDAWIEGHHRFEVLNQLSDDLAQADVTLDLLLYSQQECQERRHWRSHVIGRAYREGR